MELSVFNSKGEDTGRKVALPESVFGIEPNEHAMYLDVKQYLANQRQGTHKSKERNEVAGSTKKIKRQKGTGGARAGSLKSPVFVGGGRIFGPRPRNYSFKLNKKLKALARLSALSTLAKDERLVLVDNITIDTPKTKSFANILQSLKVGERKTLVVTKEANTNVVLSSRNLPKVKVATPGALTTYDLLNADKVVCLEESLSVFEEIYANK
ncbi:MULTISPECIES: 50S ribosomal protein L4 [Rufibacter]|uniref:Large ribosomal subunit protein uL4 n=1 Tax=Rufibacter quisquiliarum TaxID=1549639 RepID=A0A839GVP1_9BACT|nr:MULTISPECIES: 50S ribosomal protein L4 [Rufibacter]MBA9079545.1 large subunit ribosomal protein L4 [Rufibacter quisquiliarum]